jgi:hypothetical protein
MSEYLTIGVRFNDDDMAMLEAEVITAGFSGRTEAYAAYPALRAWVDELRGFPRAIGSELRFEAGGGYGHIGVVLTRLDWSGHCACRVSLLSDRPSELNEHPHNTMEVRLVVEPGAIDRFVKELAQMTEQQSGEATLAGLAQG